MSGQHECHGKAPQQYASGIGQQDHDDKRSEIVRWTR